jgi:hypothetical protein
MGVDRQAIATGGFGEAQYRHENAWQRYGRKSIRSSHRLVCAVLVVVPQERKVQSGKNLSVARVGFSGT